MNWVALEYDGATTYHHTARDAVAFLAGMDWDMPDTVLDYKVGVAQRCQVLGYHLLFWDATSFLLSGEHAGLWKVSFPFGGVL